MVPFYHQLRHDRHSLVEQKRQWLSIVAIVIASKKGKRMQFISILLVVAAATAAVVLNGVRASFVGGVVGTVAKRFVDDGRDCRGRVHDPVSVLRWHDDWVDRGVCRMKMTSSGH